MINNNPPRRILYIIREEYEQIIKETEAHPATPSGHSNPTTPAMHPAAPGLALDGLTLPSDRSEPISIASSEDSDSLAGTPTDGETPPRRQMSSLNPFMGMLEPTPEVLEDKDHERRQHHRQAVLWEKGKWKQGVLSHITEYIQELGEIRGIISDQANEHLHDGEVVLTYGYSHIVEHFCKRAADVGTKGKKKGFEVIVAEGAPKCRGRTLAMALSAAGIKTTLIPDSAVYAVMSRVSKVLIGAYAVLADGGIIAEAGTHMAAVAAQAHRTPLVVLSGLYKLSPVFPMNSKDFAHLASPAAVLPYHSVYRANTAGINAGVNHLHVRNPQCDYVPPALIHTYVTNQGTLIPSYIYRLLAEMYNPEDYVL
mmetsp:Transcript_83266/g.146823  ORF Transcript_83266/g.146823 Transcript_83266/m.146823 type:complete len:368 (-) Transcript_83266:282-1385(-)